MDTLDIFQVHKKHKNKVAWILAIIATISVIFSIYIYFKISTSLDTTEKIPLSNNTREKIMGVINSTSSGALEESSTTQQIRQNISATSTVQSSTRVNIIYKLKN